MFRLVEGLEALRGLGEVLREVRRARRTQKNAPRTRRTGADSDDDEPDEPTKIADTKDESVPIHTTERHIREIYETKNDILIRSSLQGYEKQLALIEVNDAAKKLHKVNLQSHILRKIWIHIFIDLFTRRARPTQRKRTTEALRACGLLPRVAPRRPG